MMRKLSVLFSLMILILVACDGDDGEEAAALPTATLAPLVTQPQATATPFFTRTPLPTFTPIPSETPIPPTSTNTSTPTEAPPVIGIVRSMQSINVREGPGTTFSTIRALVPGTGVEILGQNQDGSWLNIKMEDGTEGWAAARLMFIEPTTTPFPTMTPSPDQTALALGTPLPTALIGGGTVTPTPPRAAVTDTPVGTQPASPTPSGTPDPTEPFLPVIDVNAINLTATALALGVVPVSPPVSVSGQSPNDPAETPEVITPPVETTADNTANPTQAPPANPPTGGATVQEGADVFAMCNDSFFGVPAPTDLAVGSTVDVFWAWYVADPQYVEQHTEAVNYEVRLNGELLSDWRQYGTRTVQVGSQYAKYWYVPVGALDAGEYEITYRATWSEAITDGFDSFGPGTANPVEEGSCNFIVR